MPSVHTCTATQHCMVLYVLTNQLYRLWHYTIPVAQLYNRGPCCSTVNLVISCLELYITIWICWYRYINPQLTLWFLKLDLLCTHVLSYTNLAHFSSLVLDSLGAFAGALNWWLVLQILDPPWEVPKEEPPWLYKVQTLFILRNLRPQRLCLPPYPGPSVTPSTYPT